MPIPFLLAGLGVAAGVLGAGGHLSAKETNEKAQSISQKAQSIYNEAKYSLEQSKNKTEKALMKLGYNKKNILETSMRQFLDSYDKIKQVQVTESVGINELSKFTIDQQGVLELRKMTDIYSSSVTSGATGAAAGAVIALAASGSLSVVTGTLATAGSALLAGQVGAAAGIAGSALSYGAAMTPLAAIVAPVVLFTGISATIKADENLEKANTMYAQAEAAVEEMKVSETVCNAVYDRSEMFDGLLSELSAMFAECSSLLAGVVKKKEGHILKKKLTSRDFSEADLKLIAVTRALAGAVKSVIDTPILSKDGSISYEAEKVYDQTIEKLEDFSQTVAEVTQIEYNVKPIEAKARPARSGSDYKSAGNSVLSSARKVFAFVLGFICATLLAEKVARFITLRIDDFLFLDSFTANKIAVWLLICTTVIMFVGNLRDSKLGVGCRCGAGIGLSILYVQFCRTVEIMNHYIIFSIVVAVVVAAICNFFEDKKETWNFALYMSKVFMCLLGYLILFLGYAFFCKFLNFSQNVCLIISTILMFAMAMNVMTDLSDD